MFISILDLFEHVRPIGAMLNECSSISLTRKRKRWTNINITTCILKKKNVVVLLGSNCNLRGVFIRFNKTQSREKIMNACILMSSFYQKHYIAIFYFSLMIVRILVSNHLDNITNGRKSWLVVNKKEVNLDIFWVICDQLNTLKSKRKKYI